MLRKVKDWLGIEGVKIELILPDEVDIEQKYIKGKIRLYARHAQTVESIHLKMTERYSRGRGKEKRVDEYEIGEVSLVQEIDVTPEQEVDLEFTLPYTLVKSDIEEFGDKNFLYGGIAKLAKRLRNVYSEYHIVAEAKVKGTALNPFDKKEVVVRN